jgi:hypothetical protein
VTQGSTQPPNRRQFAYKVKTKPERVKEINEERRELMLAMHEAMQASITAMETKAKEVLNLSAVPTPSYVSYLNFCRELWKKAQKFAGPSLNKEAAAIAAKWKARELREDVLKELAFGVFNIPKDAI